MDTSSINEMIETAVAIEAKEGFLAKYLTEHARERGVTIEDAQRRQALDMFEGYIRSVPELLSAAFESAVGTPVETIMGTVMRAAVAYWDEPEDLVPDALGVLGLLDDSYFTLRMLQSVSERLQEKSGHALVAEDLSALDAAVRDILGDDLSEILEDLVALSLTNAPVDELIAAVAEHAGSFTPPPARTPFAGQSIDDLVEAHLSFTRPTDTLRDEVIDALEAFCSKLGGGSTTLQDQAEVIAEGTAALEQLLRAALDDDIISGESDIELAVPLLVGALVHRVVLTQREVDRGFVVRCIDLVLDGTHWRPTAIGR